MLEIQNMSGFNISSDAEKLKNSIPWEYSGDACLSASEAEEKAKGSDGVIAQHSRAEHEYALSAFKFLGMSTLKTYRYKYYHINCQIY